MNSPRAICINSSLKIPSCRSALTKEESSCLIGKDNILIILARLWTLGNFNRQSQADLFFFLF